MKMKKMKVDTKVMAMSLADGIITTVSEVSEDAETYGEIITSIGMICLTEIASKCEDEVTRKHYLKTVFEIIEKELVAIAVERAGND